MDTEITSSGLNGEITEDGFSGKHDISNNQASATLAYYDSAPGIGHSS